MISHPSWRQSYWEQQPLASNHKRDADAWLLYPFTLLCDKLSASLPRDNLIVCCSPLGRCT